VGGAVISNFSVGMVLLQQAAAARFYDCAELTELHHNRKADAPSGTCIKTAELMEELGKAFNPQQVEDTKPCPAALVAHQEVMFGLERLL
jgi:4-hydroxy-tetrahydrodipicolinate reductase